MRKNQKHLDFELNLVPFIDLLSVCICFLLITAVWINIGSLNVKQAIGGQSQAETEKKPVIWAQMTEAGDLNLEVQQSSRVPGNLRKLQIRNLQGKIDLDKLTHTIAQVLNIEPNLKTALIQPRAKSAYEEIIALMDQFKKSGLVDLGVAPL
jgi:biopolymer transport protein TolR